MLPDAWYVPANLAVAGGLVGLARSAGVSWSALGLARDRVSAGLRLGAAAGGMVAAGLAVALALPGLRPLFADARYANLSGAGLAYQTLVRIPLGTVVLEEVAFRGVLLALFSRPGLDRRRSRSAPARAVAASSALFGLWHILPTLSAAATNDLGGGAAGRAGLAAAGVVVTAVAGVVFCGLRLRSGSLLAPMLLHTATNGFGVLAAFLAHRGG